jgi:hypothetical protein
MEHRPDLSVYQYPPPTKEIIDRIGHHLLINPQFYIRVLDLMRNMNLPAPFSNGGISNNDMANTICNSIVQSKISKGIKSQDGSRSESESEDDDGDHEIGSTDDQNIQKNLIGERKRKLSEDERGRLK